MQEYIKKIEAGDILSPYVRYYWAFAEQKTFSVMKCPIGSTQLIFHRGRSLYVPELGKAQATVTLCGQMSFLTHMQSAGDLDMIIVFLTPIGMCALFDFPISEIYNREVSAEEIGDAALALLGQKIGECNDIELCFYIIDMWLRNRISERYYIRRIYESLHEAANNPYAELQKMADMACFSKKHFSRVMKDVIGINPKEFQRLLRFQRALYLMQQGCRDEQRIAAECNYADSAHMIREFRSFTSHTPLELAELQPIYSDFYSEPKECIGEIITE